jgi:DNA-binding LacI/PurR family transcriptional regulator
MRSSAGTSRGLPLRIARAITQDYLGAGRLQAGERLPTVRELASRYEASNATISQALGLLQGQGLVAKSQGRGGFVAQAAEVATAPGTRLMALVLPGPALGHLLGSLYEGVERCCRESGYHPLVLTSDWDYGTEREQVASAFAAGCAGVVLYPMPRLAGQLRKDYLNREHLDRPLVLVDMVQRAHKRSQVLFDNARACRELTACLIQAGHRRIAFVRIESPTGRLEHRSNHDRHRGYLAAMGAAGLTPRPQDQWQELFPGPDPMAAADELASRWLGQRERATAVIAASDFSALCLTVRVRAAGLGVPEDLAVVGFDNQETCHPAGLSFPTTNPDFRLAGEIAADLVLQQVRGELREPATYVLPVPVLRPG